MAELRRRNLATEEDSPDYPDESQPVQHDSTKHRLSDDAASISDANNPVSVFIDFSHVNSFP